MDNNDKMMSNDIAIIGLDCRFPGADNIQEFWQNLKSGRESISFLSNDELEKNLLDNDFRPDHPDYVKAAAFINGADLFDEYFFGYSPRDAKLMDPQQRLFLECAWNALEAAGYNPYKYDLPIGVFAGSRTNTYVYNLLYNRNAVGHVSQFDIATQNDFSCLSTRVAYKLNLKGPAYSIHTACSTGLAVVHLACQSLLTGECRMAVAGGVAINTPLKSGYMYTKDSIFSPDGHCVAFDADSKGTLFGSGIGVVVLKMLEDAIEDGDTVYAVIKGTAANNDGMQKANYTAPSVDGQAKVIEEAIMLAGIDPETISMLEAHGTGTILGDPIEVSALTKAFKKFTDKKSYCSIGSVKTNFGHLDAAAGMAGLIKTVLALKHKQIPPTLHFKNQNPDIKFEQTPFYVNTKLEEWEQGESPRRAGVSAFGIGGTNVHIILEEAPEKAPAPVTSSPQLLLFSAKTKSALQNIIINMAAFLDANKNVNLADVSFTLANKCADFDNRFFTVCKDVEEALSHLRDGKETIENGMTKVSAIKPLIFILPANGHGHIEAAAQLYQSEVLFRDHAKVCALKFAPYIGNRIEDIFNGKCKAEDVPSIYLGFVIQYALSMYLIGLGATPSTLFGSGIGGFAAACISEIISLEDGVSLIAGYYNLTNDNRDLDHPEANKKNLLTVFKSMMQKIEVQGPQIPIMSSDKGTLLDEASYFDAEYFADLLLRSPEKDHSFRQLLKSEHGILLNIGSENELCEELSIPCNETANCIIRSILPASTKESPCLNFSLNTMGALWQSGVEVDWRKSFAKEKRSRIPLPTYPMEKQRHWIDPDETSFTPLLDKLHDKKSENINDWFYTLSWKSAVILSSIKEIEEKKRKWLVFVKRDDFISSACVEYLENAGQTVIKVFKADDYDYVDEKEYNLNPYSEEDYNILFDDLKIADNVPDIIVNLWSIIEKFQTPLTIDRFDEAQYYTFYNFIFMARALANNSITKSISLISVTSDLYNVSEQGETCPEAATVVGAGLVISREYPSLVCRNIDISLRGDKQDKLLHEKILTDICSGDKQSVVAYRNNKRWVQHFETLQFGMNYKEQRNLRKNGVYLVTGGLQKTCLPIAEYLMNEFSAKIIFLNPSDEVDSSVVERLNKKGADYLLLSADFTNREDMASKISQSVKRYGSIHGVIHGADIAESNFIRSKKNDSFESLFNIKVKGTINLYSIFSESALDFFIVFSSINSSFGELGQSHVCAGNCFLDAFAQHMENSKTIPFTVLSWDTREEDINKIKNGFSGIEFPEAIAKVFQQELESSITGEEAIKAFNKATSLRELDRVVISTKNVNDRIKTLITFMKSLKGMETNLLSGQTKKSPRPNLDTEYIVPRNADEEMIALIWQDILGIEKVGIHDNFFELGGHSLLATYLVGMLREKFDLEISMDTLFEDPTIDGIIKAKAAKSDLPEDYSQEEILDFLSQLSEEEAVEELRRLESNL
ncbi:MAG: SDR family NAD(P)-dependent oxidoreductase [Clostridia bacterium]|nr:SDR family NAD(P)-dependent oxidoreductase [Clostridia bacterium]